MIAMRRTILVSVVTVVLLLLLIQVFQPARTNPPIDPRLEITAVHQLDSSVADVLARSCNDCHSNHTVWPKYSQVAPVSWLVAKDVNEGRKALNLSEWGKYSLERREKLLGEICKEVSEREMPGLPYQLMHPKARLSTADAKTVCQWTRSVTQASDAERIPAGY
jgi:Haem-binding domain